MIINLANTAVLVCVKPYALASDNRKALLGELLNLFVTEMFFVLLNIDMDEKARDWLEGIKIGILCLAILVVTLIQLLLALLSIYPCCQRKCCR